MSERGSFVTQYIYCDACLETVKRVLLRRDKGLCSTAIPSWEGQKNPDLPIIAGKIGGSAPGEEVWMMHDLVEALAPLLCHPIQIAVIPDTGAAAVLVAQPKRVTAPKTAEQAAVSPRRIDLTWDLLIVGASLRDVAKAYGISCTYAAQIAHKVCRRYNQHLHDALCQKYLRLQKAGKVRGRDGRYGPFPLEWLREHATNFIPEEVEGIVSGKFRENFGKESAYAPIRGVSG